MKLFASYAVEKFVKIFTYKVVNPTNILITLKLLCKKVVKAKAQNSLMKQIEKGETRRHRNGERGRYFDTRFDKEVT